ncbi:MAG TPA: FHA domain-containing protein [Polyangiaceae bacterium]|jgi:hypothetical protein
MSAAQYAGASRFRLRFLLQEFELKPGDTLIGRSDDCQITIFDPLVSRRHAKITILADEAILEDLGSRNGCRVNGTPIKGPQKLAVGDRIRIGKYEFVFSELTPSAASPRLRQTGSLVYCASCDMAYSGEMGMCPSCGSQQSLDEDTRSGVARERGNEAWAIDMLVELFNKALGGRREADADRIMRQIMSGLETHLSGAVRLDAERLATVAQACVDMSTFQNNGFWVHWAVDFYGRAGVNISAALADAGSYWQPTRISPAVPGRPSGESS